MIEIAMLIGIGLAILLLVVLLIRKPKAFQDASDAVATLSLRLESLGTDFSRIEGNLQMMSSSQESRIQGLAQITTTSLESLRAAVDQKLSQALSESREGRAELNSSFSAFEGKSGQKTETLETTLVSRSEKFEKLMDNRLEALIQANRQVLESLKTDVSNQLTAMAAGLQAQLEGNGIQIRNQLLIIQESVAQQMTSMTQTGQQSAEQLRAVLNERLAAIQTDNAVKLEEMRKTVDEKLHATLEQRLGQSFQLVSDRLEQVHRGLGEMQTLAIGVGDLKRVLTNVKTRGTWGEVQLEALMEQILTPEQYQKNVATRPDSNDRVEMAIRLPGRSEEGPVWLPIDAKFPVEDYQRLLDAQENADLEQMEVAAKAIEMRIKAEAKTIRDKYIAPPHTTDFALMYLPTEGLYAEVMRRTGLAETIQRDFRVVISGPSNLAALLNSLQMGFRTLAIEKRSSEVWSLLGAVKTEFGKFGDVITATQKKLEAASNQFGEVGKRTRAIARKLRDVEALPILESDPLLALAVVDTDEDAA